MLIPWKELPAVEALEETERQLRIVLSFIEVADRASAAYVRDDLPAAHAALRDYHAMRMEHAI